MTSPSAADLLVAIAEPTRLRIINCLAAAPLFVSDLQAILGLPQPTVSRHLTVLRHLGVVRDTPVGPYVLYRLLGDGQPGNLLRAILDGLERDEPMRLERDQALSRSRERTTRILGRVSALVTN